MEGDEPLLRQLITAGLLGSVAGGEPRAAEYTGTKALMLAVLEDGLRCCWDPVARVRSEAEAWIRSNRRLPFSFTVVCETLGLEPDAVRAALPRLQPTATAALRRVRPYARRQRGSSGTTP